MSWLWQVYTLELRRIFSYRIDFWMGFFVQLVGVGGTAYYLWSSIFADSHATELGGFSLPSIVLYYLLVPVIDRLTNGNSRGGVSNDIYDGSLTRYLVYPVPFYLYKYITRFAFTSLTIIQYAMVLGAFALFVPKMSDAPISLNSALLALGFTLVAGAVFFSFQFLIEMTAFWADNVWSLLVMLRFCVAFLGGATIPLSFLPERFTHFLHYTPFPAFASLPIQLALGRAGLAEATQGLWVLALWQAGLGLLCWIVWKRGTRQYTGVGI